MKLLVSNVTWSLRLCLTVLRGTSIWWPRNVNGSQEVVWRVFYILSFTFSAGINVIVQAAQLIYVFGDVSLMTGAMILLFTNISLSLKMINVVWRRDKIHEIVDENDERLRSVEGEDKITIVTSSDKFTSWYIYTYTFLSFNALYGLAASARKPNLPLPARYPYDITKSPAYELTCGHQIAALNIAALVNISLDSLVSILIAQLCCRFQLLALSLTKVCQDLHPTEKMMISEEDEKTALTRLSGYINEHQAILEKAKQIQKNFAMPVFAQLTVSSFIICVTAYQLAFEEKNAPLLWGLVTYLTVMLMQIFMYCYHGNELSIQSIKVASAAYESPWYSCSPRLRRSLLILMIRSSREVTITAGGITTLSLASFMRIIKASYSFFTVLQSVQD